MQLDATLPPVSLFQAPPIARAAEQMGFGVLWCSETTHNPFLPAALIAEHSRRMGVGTAVAIAFARSPADMAYTAWDLAEASQGRFILGLGTQVRAHIERRFGMPWPDSPTGKLGEQIEAIRSFWKCWQEGCPLDFRGKYYRLSLMSPFFNPGPINYPEIPIYLAGVNTGLACLAGETADGFLAHPLHTPEYLGEVVVQAIEKGRGRRNPAARDSFTISVTAFVITSPAEREFVRSQIAFYASTPSYRPVLAFHGWGEIGERLTALAAQRKWDQMPEQISDEMLSMVATIAEPASLARELARRYAGLADRIALYLPFIPGERDDFWKRMVEHFNGGCEKE